MIDKFLLPLLSGLIACVVWFLVLLLVWVLGRILWNFEKTKVFGFKMMAWSGFFVKELPDFCPKNSCVDCCKIWTCPRFK